MYINTFNWPEYDESSKMRTHGTIILDKKSGAQGITTTKINK